MWPGKHIASKGKYMYIFTRKEVHSTCGIVMIINAIQNWWVIKTLTFSRRYIIQTNVLCIPKYPKYPDTMTKWYKQKNNYKNAELPMEHCQQGWAILLDKLYKDTIYKMTLYICFQVRSFCMGCYCAHHLSDSYHGNLRKASCKKPSQSECWCKVMWGLHIGKQSPAKICRLWHGHGHGHVTRYRGEERDEGAWWGRGGGGGGGVGGRGLHRNLRFAASHYWDVKGTTKPFPGLVYLKLNGIEKYQNKSKPCSANGYIFNVLRFVFSHTIFQYSLLFTVGSHIYIKQIEKSVFLQYKIV